MHEVLGIPKSQKLPVSVRVDRLPQKPPELTKCPAFAPGGLKRTGARTRPGPEPPPVPTNTLAQPV